jgi:pimeloyl-ACP methyl ester carboxylesterase
MPPRVRAQHKQLSKTPDDFDGFRAAILKMWDTEPNFSADQLSKIRVRTAVADGEYDEFVKRHHTEQLASLIPDSELIILSNVSHCAMYQDGPQFNAAVIGFLTRS